MFRQPKKAPCARRSRSPTPRSTSGRRRRADAENLDRALLDFSAAFGLHAVEDHRSANRNGVVRIEVSGGARGFYIPYTDKPIAWHTDGYYNYHGPAKNVQAMILHCAEAADEGGENRLLDPELAFLRLAEFDVSALRLLLHPEAMIIPEARDEAGRVRAENRGPVFFLATPARCRCATPRARKTSSGATTRRARRRPPCSPLIESETAGPAGKAATRTRRLVQQRPARPRGVRQRRGAAPAVPRAISHPHRLGVFRWRTSARS